MNKNLFIIIGSIALIIGLYSLQKLSWQQDLQFKARTQGVIPMRTAKVLNEKRTIDILFIGNSYTFFHDTIGTIINLANHDPKNTTTLNIQSVAFGGTPLIEHWKNDQTRAILNSRKWDAVILQDSSLTAMYPNLTATSFSYIKKFSDLAKRKGAVVFVFKTWPRKPDTHWYSISMVAPVLKSFDHMHQSIDNMAHKLERDINVSVIPIGDYWYFAVKNSRIVSIYDDDGTHQSASGSYLNALIFYKYFTGRSPVSLTFVPRGVSKKEAATLRKIAAQKL